MAESHQPDNAKTIRMVTSIEKYLDSEEAFNLLDKLISAPTVNPPGDEHLGFTAIEPELRRLGLSVEKFPSSSSRMNFIVWWPEKRAAEKTFIFNGHMDVVPIGDRKFWSCDPFRATRWDGKIYGRGTADMKGSIAAIIEASALLDRSGFKPEHGCIAMQFVSDEEVLGSQGTAYLLETEKILGDLAVVGEPTTRQIVVAARGVVWAAVDVLGKAAHGSVPHLGINAIEKMYGYLQAIRTPEPKSHALLGGPSRNIGVIRGGEKVNMVAPTCHVEIDRRILPQEPVEEVKAEFLEAIELLQRRDDSFKATVDFFCIAEPSEIPVDSEIVRIAQRATERIRGKRAPVTGFPGASDARFLINQRKIPTIIYGVGDLAQAHTVDEHVLEKEFHEMCLIYAEMIRDFLS